MDSVCSIATNLDRNKIPVASEQSSEERESFLLGWTTKSCSFNALIDLEEGWEILFAYGIQMIHKFLSGECSTEEMKRPIGTKGFASLHAISYKLSTTPRLDNTDYTKDLYDRCKKSVKDFVDTYITQRLLKLLGGDRMSFLRMFIDSWAKHKLLTKWMYRLFSNLDKTVVIIEVLPTITSCYLNCFYEGVFLHFDEHIRLCVIESYAKDREGGLLDNERDVLREVVEVSPLFLFCCTVMDGCQPTCLCCFHL